MKKKNYNSQIIEKSPKGRYVCYNDILGRGAYKIVYRGYDTHNGIEVAWNSIYIDELSFLEQESIIKEIKVLKEISSKNDNIVGFFNAWINKEKSNVVLITEIALSGTLYDYIRKIKNINMRVIKKWCVQILKGLDFLHDQNIAHRDLKCKNIFYNSNSGSVIIGDFGLAKKKETNFHSFIGTPEFMAPEMYHEKYDEKVDIYAFGMCMLEMITQKIPFQDLPLGAIIKTVQQGNLPKIINDIKNQKAKQIIISCLDINPNERPSAKNLLNNPFFTTFDDDDNDDNLCFDNKSNDYSNNLDNLDNSNKSNECNYNISAQESIEEDDNIKNGDNNIEYIRDIDDNVNKKNILADIIFVKDDSNDINLIKPINPILIQENKNSSDSLDMNITTLIPLYNNSNNDKNKNLLN